MLDDTKLKLLQQLNHKEVEKRREAILQLGSFKDPHIFKILSSYFTDDHPGIRDALFQVFTQYPERWVAEIAADNLLSPRLSVRSLAMDILRNFGKEAIWPLKRIIKSADPFVRKTVIELLGQMPFPEATEVLLNQLSENHPDVLFALIEAFGNHCEIRAVPFLSEKIRESEDLRLVAAQALLKIFSKWEDNIFQEYFIFGESITQQSVLDAMRDNPVFSHLPLILKIIQNTNDEDVVFEAVQTLSLFAEKFPHHPLPIEVFYQMKKIWKRQEQFLLPETLLKILPVIPDREALYTLLSILESQGAEQSFIFRLTQFAINFPTIFFDNYLQISPEIRTTVLHQLIENKVGLCYDRAAGLLKKIKTDREKKNLLLVWALGKSDGILDILFKHYKLKDLKDPEFMSCLLNYKDERLFPLYLESLLYGNSRMRGQAIRSLVALGRKGIEALSHSLETLPAEEWPRVMNIMGFYRISDSFVFWKNFVQSMNEVKWQLIQNFLLQNDSPLSLSLIILAMSCYSHNFDSLQNFIQQNRLSLTFSEEFWQLFETQPQEVQERFLQWLKKIGLGIHIHVEDPEQISSASRSQGEKKAQDGQKSHNHRSLLMDNAINR